MSPRAPSVTDCPIDYFPITPGVDFTRECNMISFSGAGSLILTTPEGNTRTIPDGALAAGIQHVLRFTAVGAGSGATGIVGYTYLPSDS